MKDNKKLANVGENLKNQEPEETRILSKNSGGLNISAVGSSESGKELDVPEKSQPIYSSELEIEADLKRAAMLFQQLELGDAEAIYRKILDKDRSQPVALNMLGAIAYAACDYEQAIDLIKLAIFEDSEYATAYNNLGLVLGATDRHEEAIEALNHCLSLNPNDSIAHYNMGCSLLGLRQLDSAMASANKAISLAPDSIDNLILSARILHDGERYEDAITVAEKILSQDTSPKLIHNIMGHSLELLGHYNQALESYNLALSIDPNDAETLVNLGHLFFSLGQLDSSIEVLERAVENDPTNGAALKGLGYAYLSIGQIKAGMIALESRWLDPEYEHLYKDYMHLQWDGIQDLIGKTIWLWPEARPKDMVIWSSTIPQLSGRSKRCIVEVSPKFVPLFSRSFPNVEVRETTKEIDQNLAVFDTHLPMGSLFLHSDIGPSSECDAFLVPDPVRVDYWRKRLAELGPSPYIGISWKSPFVNLSRAPNYTVIDDWKPIFGQKAVFINLQSGECQSDLEHAIQELGCEIHNFEDLDLYDDVDDVAALSAALDLAISVSTTVAAITAGVGTETWLLSWKESHWNNILHAPRGPKVVNFERSIVNTWELIFMDMASRLSDRSSAIAR